MNINDLKTLPQRLNKASQSNQQRSYLSNSTTDTFEKTTSAVSFKGRETKVAKTLQESAKDILANSEILAKFGAFTAAAFAGLAALASGKSDETTQVAETLVTAFNKSEESNEKPTHEIINDINDDDIRVITLEYKEIEETPQEKDEEEVLDAGTNEYTNLVQVTFPKKRGRLSKLESSLKDTVENLKLHEDSSNKLSEICMVAVKEASISFDKYGFDTKYLIDQISSNSEDNESVESFINKIYNTYKTIKGVEKKSITESHSSDEVDKTEFKPNVETKTESQKVSEEIFIPEGETEISEAQKTSQPKIVGTIDLTRFPQKNKKVEAAKASKGDEIPIPDNNSTTIKKVKKSNPKKDFTETTLNAVDKENGILNFKIPGTLEPNVKNNLTRLLLKFQEYILKNETEKVRWMFRSPIPENVLADDIKKEINYRKGGNCPYKNITTEDAEALAEVINNDSRFKDLFNLHSALRLIDRFVNFDSDKPLEEQCDHAISKLYEAIQKALSNGVDIEVYEDSKYNTYAARIVIEPDKETNPAAYEIAGSYPLKITICENQEDPMFYARSKKLPLISTIFSKGL